MPTFNFLIFFTTQRGYKKVIKYLNSYNNSQPTLFVLIILASFSLQCTLDRGDDTVQAYQLI